jgi:hypothetical protein
MPAPVLPHQIPRRASSPLIHTLRDKGRQVKSSCCQGPVKGKGYPSPWDHHPRAPRPITIEGLALECLKSTMVNSLRCRPSCIGSQRTKRDPWCVVASSGSHSCSHPLPPRIGRADPGRVPAAGGRPEEGDEPDAEGDGPWPEAGDPSGGQCKDVAHLRAFHPRRLRYLRAHLSLDRTL